MRTYQVPTHLRTPETVLTLAGVRLSARQCLLLILGSALSYDGWLHLAVLATLFAGPLLRLVLSLFPALVATALAFVQLAGRDLPIWVWVFLRYWLRQRRFVWCSVRFQDTGLLNSEEEQHG